MTESAYNFRNYDDIPVLLQEYLLTVSDADKIDRLEIDDINSFLNGLMEFTVPTYPIPE